MSDGELSLQEAVKQNVPKQVQEELDNLRTALQRLQDERHYVLPVRMKVGAVIALSALFVILFVVMPSPLVAAAGRAAATFRF